MVLSNAERQARYRKRLVEKAAGAVPPRDAVDAAWDALWALHNRPLWNGQALGDVDCHSSAREYQRDVSPSDAAALLRETLVEDADKLSDAERDAMERGLAVYEAATHKHLENKPAKGKRRK